MLDNLVIKRALLSLPIRYSVAVAYRALLRMDAPSIWKQLGYEDYHHTDDRKVFDVSLGLIENFCINGLLKDHTPLAEMYEESRWLDSRDKFACDNKVIMAGSSLFDAICDANFGSQPTEGVTEYNIALNISNNILTSLRLLAECANNLGHAYHKNLITMIESDIEFITNKAIDIFPALGGLIDIHNPDFIGALLPIEPTTLDIDNIQHGEDDANKTQGQR